MTESLELRQEPLPKAHDPYEWTGWPLFEAYGLTGDGRPVRRQPWSAKNLPPTRPTAAEVADLPGT